MTRSDVYEMCKKVAPKYGFDPILILAMCEQESSYDPTEVRLEQGFYRKYTRPMNFPAPVEVMFAASYGLMQLMGESLYEMSYFGSLASSAVASRLEQFEKNPEEQIGAGCEWLRHKMSIVKTEDVSRGLRLYNGSIAYPPLVMKRFEKLVSELTVTFKQGGSA